jgi:hypothetical protein
MKEALSSSATRFLQEPHGVTPQKTPFFKHWEINTDMKIQWVSHTYAKYEHVHQAVQVIPVLQIQYQIICP